jgi:predicted GNAT family acetyltransferase
VSDIIDNESKARFEVTIEGHLADLTYKLDGDRIVLIHTGVPKELEGHGLAAELVRFAIARAVRDGLTIVPICPYARSYFQKHPEAIADAQVDWLATG